MGTLELKVTGRGGCWSTGVIVWLLPSLPAQPPPAPPAAREAGESDYYVAPDGEVAGDYVTT